MLDVNMPLMDGIETLRELKKINPDCVVVMLTSLANRQTIDEAVANGAANYIRKDAPLEEIGRALAETMLSLGADKGLHGVGLFMAEPSDVIAKTPIRHLADFKGKKLRTFASKFQTESFNRLGATAVVMTLGDVVPALQQGAIDGAVAGMGPFTKMHFVDAAKYITMTNQPGIFLVAEVNRKWFEALPKDLQDIVDKDAAAQSIAINPTAVDLRQKAEANWTAAGGELIDLPPDEQASMMQTLSSVGADVSKTNPQLADAYKILTDAAARTRSGM